MAYKKIADMDEDRAKTYELEQVYKHFIYCCMLSICLTRNGHTQGSFVVLCGLT
jgi:hypothetical protein